MSSVLWFREQTSVVSRAVVTQFASSRNCWFNLMSIMALINVCLIKLYRSMYLHDLLTVSQNQIVLCAGCPVPFPISHHRLSVFLALTVRIQLLALLFWYFN
jgi:hypothetical protein